MNIFRMIWEAFIDKFSHNPPSGYPLPPLPKDSMSKQNQSKGGGEFVQLNLHTGKATPVHETDAGKLFEIIARGECPHCHRQTKFWEGPSGGMSTNIQCSLCDWWYNVSPIGIAEEIGLKD